MKKIYFILTAMAVILSTAVKAQTVIAGWDFNTYSTNAAINGPINATNSNANLSSYSLSRGDEANAIGISYGFFTRVKAKSPNNTKNDALGKKDYFLVALKASTGYKLSLSKIAFKLRGTTTAGNSPNAYRWSYSTNGTDFTEIETSDRSFTSTDNVGEVQSEINLSSITALQGVAATTTVTLRMLVWGAGTVSATDIGFGRNSSGVSANVLAVEGAVESTTLPVNLTSFTAKSQANTVQLNWQTASEQNNSRFDILRSTDGINFIKIGQKVGAGNSISTQNYSYLDTKPLVGTSYYALKQYDINGDSKQYDAVPVKFNLSSNLITATAIPSGIKVGINAEKEEKASLSIYDISGARLANKQVDLNQGFNEVEVNSFNLVSGKLYLVKLKTATQNQTVKVIK